MIYECAFCEKLYDEDDGMMVLEDEPSFIILKHIYVFKCKNCMEEDVRKKFEKFKKKK